ncbi:MAG TPA: hypothetical protein DCW35_02055, partial [Polynucleobacter sp.]|nr:hypothetical protein [Polynucleobacter sp.]
ATFLAAGFFLAVAIVMLLHVRISTNYIKKTRPLISARFCNLLGLTSEPFIGARLDAKCCTLMNPRKKAAAPKDNGF